MTNSDITFWTMVGTWVAGLGTLLAVVISLYLSISSRTTKLSLRLRIKKNGSMELIVLNRGHVYAEIEEVNLVQRRLFSSNKVYRSYGWNDLTRWFTESDTFDETELKLFPNSHARKFSLEFERLRNQYSWFLPYDRDGVLNKPTKMPKVSIGVFLSTGEVFYIKLPISFYTSYREFIGSQFDQIILNLSDSPDKYFVYQTSKELHIMQQDCLHTYSQSRKNYHLLLS